MSDLLLLLVAGVNFFGGLVIGEYVWKFLEEKNETTESLFSAENVRKFLKENPPKEEGKKAFDLLESERNSEYQRGLDDAWEAAKKIVEMTDPPYWEVFDEYKNDLFGKVTASEAIEKLKAYEEKQKAEDKVEVGDEVEVAEKGIKFFVTKIYDADGTVGGINKDGEVRYWSRSLVKPTGRHFNIVKILEGIKHD